MREGIYLCNEISELNLSVKYFIIYNNEFYFIRSGEQGWLAIINWGSFRYLDESKFIRQLNQTEKEMLFNKNDYYGIKDSPTQFNLNEIQINKLKSLKDYNEIYGKFF